VPLALAPFARSRHLAISGPKSQSASRSRIYGEGVTFEQIFVDHRIMGGVPCVQGTRIPVATVVAMIAEGMDFDEIVTEFPRLTLADIQESLRYAAAVDVREIPLQPTG
jgi:uncharacterized protein (DUF433 family)